MAKEFEVGKTYWAIRMGWGNERVTQVKLTEACESGGRKYFESKDVGPDAHCGTCGIDPRYLFHTEAEALAFREKMVQDRIAELRAKTDTPEKMLQYFLGHLHNCEYDGHVEWKAKTDLEKRAREMFSLPQ